MRARAIIDDARQRDDVMRDDAPCEAPLMMRLMRRKERARSVDMARLRVDAARLMTTFTSTITSRHRRIDAAVRPSPF